MGWCHRRKMAPPKHNSTTEGDTGEHPPQPSNSDDSMVHTLTEKMQNLTYSEDQDEAIDFSRKYDEKWPPTTTETKGFSVYVENDDSDELINYSILYSEDTYEDSKMAHGDQVKIYCTEGTPYHTPLNFSTATSMTDLHEIGGKDSQNQAADEKVDTSFKENLVPPTADSQKSSGITTPEKPVMYCEEGTPVCFSRMPSLSSLNSGGDGGGSKGNPSLLKMDHEDSQGKTVHWGVCVVEPEDTPLMFSRSSSPSSLGSCDQYSIRSSVISDFSRRTSEVVSPSDLPDSPEGTTPPSPRIPRISSEFACNITKPSPDVTTFTEAPKLFKGGTPTHSNDDVSLDAKDDAKKTDKLTCKEVVHEDAVKEESEDFLSGDEDMLAACISIAMPEKNKGYSRRGLS